MMFMAARLSGLLPTTAGPGFQPGGNVFRLVTDGGADLDILRPLPQEPPPPDGSHRGARDARHVVLVQQGFENTIYRCHFAPFLISICDCGGIADPRLAFSIQKPLSSRRRQVARVPTLVRRSSHRAGAYPP